MVKNQMWTIIGVSIVVALVVSLVTASITGNIIKVKKTVDGTAVYTKYDIDKKLEEVYSRIDSRISEAITNLLEDIITDEIFEPLEEVRSIKHCDQYVEVEEGTEKSFNLGGEYYNLNLINVSSSNSATIQIGNVVKPISEDQKYDFGVVSSSYAGSPKLGNLKVYVKGIQSSQDKVDYKNMVMLEISNCVL